MHSVTFVGLLCAASALAAPAPAPAPVAAPQPTPAPVVDERDLSGLLPQILKGVENGIVSDLNQLSQAGSAYLTLIKDTIPTATPASLGDVPAQCSRAIGTSAPKNIVDSGLSLVVNGLSSKDLFNDALRGYVGGINAQSPRNRAPRGRIYPKKDSKDAPYKLSESALRSSIFIPSTFQYGRNNKQPLILIPGTGAFGGVNFQSNFIKLLAADPVADPVWLNIPGAMLDDAQSNAEHIAYAINYIASLSSRKVALLGWSQGNLDAQWALKYWPSARARVTDLVAISPDYHGTVNAYALCPGFPKTPCCPGVRQQDYGSAYVAALRRNGGDSAYVPTTNIYSSLFDEIVQPQSGDSASGRLLDARRVGVTNNQVQKICPGQPGGAFYTHEGVLFNSVAWALARDALTHDGPGRTDRIDLNEVCAQFAAPGLSLTDALATEGLIPLAAANILLHPQKEFVETPLRAYAR
jgi:pimeloyl-ACP methyl ester carboxylesterase